MAKKKWIDETGNEIPVARVTAYEKKKEKIADKLFKEALKINAALINFKDSALEVSEDLFNEIMQQAGVEKAVKSKGNFTFYNFDRSLKFEINVNERIVFDDALITACKQKLMSFIDSKIVGVDSFIKNIVMDAFETRNGKLDTRKVMGLLKHRKTVKDTTFLEALDLLEASIKRPSSKKYFRIWQRSENGEYINIELNFTAV